MQICLVNLLINTFLTVYGGCIEVSAEYLIVKSNRGKSIMNKNPSVNQTVQCTLYKHI